MNDRELLEMAAKANNDPKIYKDIGEFYRIIGRNEDMGCDVLAIWNPLSDDGDAFRLAVKLKMVVDTDHNGGAVAGNAKIALEMPEYGYQEGAGKKDIYAATRRAIVRAAAEIGINMK